MSKYLLFAAAFVICQFHAFAQTATGTLQGVVTDASGAAVADAKVTVENQRTNVKQSLVTNGEGRFVQPFLVPSEYRLTVEKSGFQKYLSNDIKVDVQQTVGVDVALKVGDVTSTVEVTSSAVQLSTETSSVSTVVDMKRILDMPLNGRNPFSLAQHRAGGNPWRRHRHHGSAAAEMLPATSRSTAPPSSSRRTTPEFCSSAISRSWTASKSLQSSPTHWRRNTGAPAAA